jgi:hypothetical protein
MSPQNAIHPRTLFTKTQRTLTTRLSRGVLLVMGAGCLALLSPAALAQGSAFTYQGRLGAGGSPANGVYDLTFTLFNTNTGAGTVAGPVTNSAVAVSNGLFAVTLDFGGSAFNGAERWLEIGVRSNGVTAFTTLAARQKITPTPYAIFAAGANAAGLSGTVSDLQLGGLIARTNQVWLLSGNAGTSFTNFLGTTDNQALELRVNNSRALRVEPQPLSPNLVGGSAANSTALGMAGAQIGGGGRVSSPNFVSGNFGVVAGGHGNAASEESVVSGGAFNVASGIRVVVAGGVGNIATNAFAVASGGASNLASGGFAVVSGGWTNKARGTWSAVGGGRENIASGESATASGGERNWAPGKQATASGGVGNESRGEFSTVGGGGFNQADFPASTVSGGQENAALNLHATVGGGVGNYALAEKSTIAGGANNVSSGPYASVPGGKEAQPTQHGQVAHAAGMFVNPGDSQHSVFVLRARTDIFFPTADMTLDGGPVRLRIEPNRTMTFDIMVAARAEPPLTDSAGFHFRGVVKNSGGIATFVGLPTATVLGADVPLWSAALVLGVDTMTVSVNSGVASGYTATVRWSGRLDAAEVAW